MSFKQTNCNFRKMISILDKHQKICISKILVESGELNH